MTRGDLFVKALLAAALVLASAAVAFAEPWQTDSFESEGELVGLTAYKWEDGVDNVLFGYECDALFGLESLYVQTEDLYDDTAGYAPDVPTTFTVDGASYQLTGIFQNRDGYVFTFYDGIDDGFFDLFDRLLLATDTITVAFYDKRFSFSAEGIGDALAEASAGCF